MKDVGTVNIELNHSDHVNGLKKTGMDRYILFVLDGKGGNNVIYKLYYSDAGWTIEALKCSISDVIMPEDDDPFWYFSTEANAIACKNQIILRKDEVHTCKECGRYFHMNRAEINWFEEKGLNKPKRCLRCRKSKDKGKSL